MQKLGYKKWLLTKHGMFRVLGVSSLVFKIVDSKDAVIKATRMYLRRILKAKLETTCNKFIVI